ncbi:SDR family NAD(P)-dependent oxidoreductase [Chitinophagaceae bacterium MMS25-I14]
MSTYLIIGGSSGIGEALVDILSPHHTVYATYCSHKRSSENADVMFRQLNVLDEEQDLSYLPESLDGLVYCPGAINLKPFSRFSVKEFEEDYRLQVSGAVRIIQAVLPRLKKSGAASVVLFSTVAVIKGFPFHSMISASKGAVEGLCRALAAELAPVIRVNCIAPSVTDTPLTQRLLDTDDKRLNNAKRHPLKKIGSATDIAELAAFLLSSKSSWITGQILHADGGLSSIAVL